ncbi:hypothetical protein FAZ69_03880 [Trinickia terrae]|uniref:TIR domain-containing protein n=1 Tax=Trinickia terrae TaxID=2571161 RepID=A0A4U1IDQ6_9BURK|nr:hypothetical protein FAZ69_03880 [Trinickia terrae]
MPELPERLVDAAQDAYTLIVLVTGEYLDDHANQERTKIALPKRICMVCISTWIWSDLRGAAFRRISSAWASN